MIDEELNAVFVPNTGRYKFGTSENKVCLYNNVIDCEEKDRCGKCGWNPAVAKQRTNKIRRALREQDKG